MIATLIYLLDFGLRIGLSARVILRRMPVGVTIAWLFVILVFPFLGAACYLLLGELRIGRRRAERARAFAAELADAVAALDDAWRAALSENGSAIRGVARLGASNLGAPPLAGNRLSLLDDAQDALRAILADIDRAQKTCYLEFYIWNPGGTADEVAEAVIRAAARGVDCRVLVDAVGSRDFLRSHWAGALRRAGVPVRAALPAGILRALFVRFDLRLHRKIVAIDGAVAFTGSMNLVDPRYFKQEANVGQWIDAMARIEGPAAIALRTAFEADWEMETGEDLSKLDGSALPRRKGEAPVQVLCSGPASPPRAIQDVLLAAIYSAQSELVLTTPYFVPDELLLSALTTAARRGVDVQLIVPRHVDSRLVRLATEAQRGDLADAGVQILEFAGGLLHTKSVTIDGEYALFGSLNLDPRSLNLNFEITLAVYDRSFAAAVRELQRGYAQSSAPFDLSRWRQRTLPTRLLQDSARLVGPLL